MEVGKFEESQRNNKRVLTPIFVMLPDFINFSSINVPFIEVLIDLLNKLHSFCYDFIFDSLQ